MDSGVCNNKNDICGEDNRCSKVGDNKCVPGRRMFEGEVIDYSCECDDIRTGKWCEQSKCNLVILKGFMVQDEDYREN